MRQAARVKLVILYLNLPKVKASETIHYIVLSEINIIDVNTGKKNTMGFEKKCFLDHFAHNESENIESISRNNHNSQL